MKENAQLPPAFGEASLSNCEREQIHLPGSIQPHGALLVLDEQNLDILQASINVAEFLGLDADKPLRNASDVGHGLIDCLAPILADKTFATSAIRLPGKISGAEIDGLVHRGKSLTVIVELLRTHPEPDLSDRILHGMQSITNGKTREQVFTSAAEEFYQLTGYDRVMVYRFDDEGHGQVAAERFEKDLEPFLGTRYPASDIPQMARRLYLENRVRMLVDVDYTPVRVEPRLNPASGEELDMSMCFLRSISPIHTQYLKNMGVAATLVVSIVVGGQLWGLIACHHYSPRRIPRSVCTASEFLSEVLAMRIAELDAYAEAQSDRAVRHFETHLMEAISRYGDWKSGLFGKSRYLLRPMDAEGAALFIDNEIHTSGDVPGTNDLREIRQWLDKRSPQELFHTTSLGSEAEQFEKHFSVASGLLSVPVSRTPGEYLVWFRPQQLRVDIWGGDPSKAVHMGDDPMDLSPRRSFAKWYQEVEGTSVPWSSASMSVADRIGQSVADALLHSRAVRAVIADDQLSKAIRHIGNSELPVIIANVRRQVLHVNEAFHTLLPPGTPHIDSLENLPRLFEKPQQFQDLLTNLCDGKESWRGEVALRQRSGGSVNLLLRADFVQVPPSRVLGYLLMFVDLAEVEAAEFARRKFQELIHSPDALGGVAPNSPQRLLHRQLLSTFVGEAENAALEIANGIDITRVPAMLNSVRDSVGRSSSLLQQLMTYIDNDRD